MKTSLLVSLLSCAFVCSCLNAQTKTTIPVQDSGKVKKPIDKYPTLDLYAAVPFQQNGAGAGMGIFTPAARLGNGLQPLHFRLGGEFYITQLSHRSVGNVPLSAPQTGEAKVRLSQNLLAFQLVGRFSAPYSERVTQYADLFIGGRNIWTSMRITPNELQEGYEESTSQTLSNAWQFCYGASAGVLWGIGKNVKINTGLMYTSSYRTSEVADISKARLTSGTIVTENAVTPKSLWVLKVGLTFIITEDKTQKQKCHCDCEDHQTYSDNSWNSSSTTTTGNSGGRSNNVNVNVKSSK